MVIEPLGEHEVVLLLLQLGLLLLVARGLGVLATRLGLPSVVGELLAGVVLGPSLFGAIAPGAFAEVFPQDAAQVHLLEVVSLLGVVLLLIVTGLETDLQLIARKGRKAAAISLCGIVVPFAAGFALGQLLPAAYLVDGSERLVFSLFLGTAMGISAIPVIAKVLMEMGVIRRDIGQITLAAGMIDDTIGWILLSIVAGLARSGVVDVPSVVQSLLSVVLVVGLAFTAGRRAVAVAFREVDNRVGGEAAKLTLLLILALLYGSLTHFLGIEAVLGAFLVGITAGQSRRLDHRTRATLEAITVGVFAPIFFAASGLRVDLAALADPGVFAVGMLVLSVAIAGKFVGAALGARISGLGRWEALSLGAGMNARGAIEIIVATIGLSLGILTIEIFTIILLVAITTSLMAPPILRVTLRRVPYGAEEQARLDAEARQASSFLGSLSRVLLPTRGGRNSQLAGRLLGLMLDGRSDVEVTTMILTAPATAAMEPRPRPTGGAATLADAPAERAVSAVEAGLRSLPRSERRRLIRPAQDDVGAQILEEARRGYGLLVMGASGEPTVPRPDRPLFGGLVDRLVQGAPGPVLVVSHPSTVEDVSDVEPRRVLLSVAGTEHESNALEVAMALARASDGMVEVLHVITEADRGGLPAEDALVIGERLLHSIAEEAHAAGVPIRTHVVSATRPELGVLETATRLEVDVIVLAPPLRPISGRAHFGHHVDHILSASTRPVVIVS
ncbi:cation:proton antiporter [Euzebya tangerina]|uniref:cation:proton antiporter domain-containing protein n=1 Tax=Euzebya tangerina TaxID=591198 RepID=UPI000E318797|nr:cation:proton antiporter [Euzebya tangerina]